MSASLRVPKHRLPFPQRSRALLGLGATLHPTLGPSSPPPWERSVVSALQSSGPNSPEDQRTQKRFPLPWVFIFCHKVDFFLGSLMVRIFSSLGENYASTLVSFLASPHLFFLSDFWSLESGCLGLRETHVTEIMKGVSSPTSRLCKGSKDLTRREQAMCLVCCLHLDWGGEEVSQVWMWRFPSP